MNKLKIETLGAKIDEEMKAMTAYSKAILAEVGDVSKLSNEELDDLIGIVPPCYARFELCREAVRRKESKK